MLLPCGQISIPPLFPQILGLRKVQFLIIQLVNDRARICTQVSANSCFYIKLPPSFKWAKDDGLRERNLDLALDIFPSFQIKDQSLLPGFLGTCSA